MLDYGTTVVYGVLAIILVMPFTQLTLPQWTTPRRRRRRRGGSFTEYEIYDGHHLLYIGQTTRDIAVRLAEHARTKAGWPKRAVVKTRKCRSQAQLDRVERSRIRSKNPRDNKIRYNGR